MKAMKTIKCACDEIITTSLILFPNFLELSTTSNRLHQVAQVKAGKVLGSAHYSYFVTQTVPKVKVELFQTGPCYSHSPGSETIMEPHRH